MNALEQTHYHLQQNKSHVLGRVDQDCHLHTKEKNLSFFTLRRVYFTMQIQTRFNISNTFLWHSFNLIIIILNFY